MLLSSLEEARATLGRLQNQRAALGVPDAAGIVLEFESEPGFELTVQSLDRQQQGIELLAVRERGNVTLATVFVPEGKLSTLVHLIEAYRDKLDARSKAPRNRNLVESISAIRHAALESFWTDDNDLLPSPGAAAWWEVWLRVGSNGDRLSEGFLKESKRLQIRTQPWQIHFADRTVLLAYATREKMSASVDVLDSIAELRRAKERPDFFTALEPREQAEWVNDMIQRLHFEEGDLPAVCVLDTGVSRGHPLLRSSLVAGDLQSCDPDWGVDDHDGHGTEMAGLALFGDLTIPLTDRGPVSVEHRLESVKILPPPHFSPNDPELYGSLTLEAMGRIEVLQPHRERVFSLAVTTPDSRDHGRPSSWSAALDAAAAGIDTHRPRLVIVAAGNIEREHWSDTPDRNDLDEIHDPGQAWNALTVGACTEKFEFDPTAFPGWTPAARPGGLSPSSTTSMTWETQWPNKPDIVAEGGNGLLEPASGIADTDDSMLLLSTNWRPDRRLLTATGDTSAACAGVARMAAILMARYPGLWPETVRGLIVHSAEWTEEMKRATSAGSNTQRVRTRLSRYGLGVPDLARACWSASNSLTLIAQETLRPFEKRGQSISTKDMNLHAFPWPQEELLALGDTPVELRITLSYFIEPDPRRRGRSRKFRYQSHGLHFAIRAPAEDLQDFRARVSKNAQDDVHKADTPDDPGWIIGSTQRNRGSIHSDIWRGIAADLAQRNTLAVYPVGGWWKERHRAGRWERDVRYALTLSIKTPEETMDIYTPVAKQVAVATKIVT